jgi:hypothetical protein
MKKTILMLVCGVAAITGQAQAVFQAENVPGLGAPGYFEIGADTGVFEIDAVALPLAPSFSTAQIITPAGTLSFSLGFATPCFFSLDTGNLFPNPYIPPPPSKIGAPLELNGEFFSGSFASSPDVYADLLDGLGEFEVNSGTSTPIELVATPEPGSAVLFLCGLVLLLLRRGIRRMDRAPRWTKITDPNGCREASEN